MLCFSYHVISYTLHLRFHSDYRNGIHDIFGRESRHVCHSSNVSLCFSYIVFSNDFHILCFSYTILFHMLFVWLSILHFHTCTIVYFLYFSCALVYFLCFGGTRRYYRTDTKVHSDLYFYSLFRVLSYICLTT